MDERKLNETISIDCVIFGFDFEKLNVLVVDRKLEQDGQTVIDDKTLTGNHIYEDEDLDTAARRILFDLTGLNNIYLEQFSVFGTLERTQRAKDQLWIEASGRDPQTRIISIGYVALLTKRDVVLEWKGRNVQWLPVDEITDLAFDHMDILQAALKYIRHKIELEPKIGFELLPEKFTLSQLQSMFQVVFGTQFDKRNFRRKALNMPYIAPLDEKQIGKTNKPAQLFVFDGKRYQKAYRAESIGQIL